MIREGTGSFFFSLKVEDFVYYKLEDYFFFVFSSMHLVSTPVGVVHFEF